MDIYNREKWRDLLIVFVLGGAMAQFCLLFYDYFHFNLDFTLNGEFVNDFLYSTIVIGGSEELVKLLPWLLFGFLAKKFKEPFDFILYASVAALGFAFVENLHYFQDYRNITMRTMISTVSHMFDASLVAFAFVIARTNYSGKTVKQIVVVIIGFLAAILAHGFYDFWIISEAVEEYTFLTMVFFIISLHLWFHFKNTAMNHSPYFCGNQRFDTMKQQDILNFGIVCTLMIQYVLMAWYIGATNVFFMFVIYGIYVAVFMVYISYQLDQLTFEKSTWKKLSLKNILPFKKAGGYFEKFGNSLTNSRSRQGLFGTILGSGGYRSTGTTINSMNPEDRDLSGLELRLFAPKSNKYIGSDLPVSGVFSYKVKVGGNPNWYVFKLNIPVQFNGYISYHIILKNKDVKQSLMDDKIEIYFMFIPSEDILQQREIDISELRYAGRSYSRPLNKERF